MAGEGCGTNEVVMRQRGLHQQVLTNNLLRDILTNKIYFMVGTLNHLISQKYISKIFEISTLDCYSFERLHISKRSCLFSAKRKISSTEKSNNVARFRNCSGILANIWKSVSFISLVNLTSYIYTYHSYIPQFIDTKRLYVWYICKK